MDKLTRYNQKILAVIGTLALVGLGILILIGGISLAIELFDSFGNNRPDDDVITLNNKEDSMVIRDQQISFELPELIDTLNAIYLVPIRQVNLEDPEIISVADEVDIIPNSKFRKRNYGYRQYGRYNNLVVYHRLQNKKKAIFDQKVLILSYQHYEVQDQLFVLVVAVNHDSNQDDKLTNKDNNCLYTYNTHTEELREFSFDGLGLVDYYIPFDANEVVLRYAVDKNSDGEINTINEPAYLKQLDLTNYKINDFLDDQAIKEIQQLID